MAPKQPAVRPDAPVSRLKRLIVVFAALLTIAALLVVFGLISLTVRQTGDGADPDRAFSPTQNIPGALTAALTWAPDAEDLVRQVEPATREQLGSMWLRADDALTRAAGGDIGGLEVWFVDAALGAALGRFGPTPPASQDGVDAPTLDVAPALGHRMRVDFYSLDGQVVVLTAETIRLRPTGTSGGLIESIEQVEAMAVLSDGNWRIRHLERLTPREDGIQIQS